MRYRIMRDLLIVILIVILLNLSFLFCIDDSDDIDEKDDYYDDNDTDSDGDGYEDDGDEDLFSCADEENDVDDVSDADNAVDQDYYYTNEQDDSDDDDSDIFFCTTTDNIQNEGNTDYACAPKPNPCYLSKHVFGTATALVTINPSNNPVTITIYKNSIAVGNVVDTVIISASRYVSIPLPVDTLYIGKVDYTTPTGTVTSTDSDFLSSTNKPFCNGYCHVLDNAYLDLTLKPQGASVFPESDSENIFNNFFDRGLEVPVNYLAKHSQTALFLILFIIFSIIFNRYMHLYREII